MAQNIISADKIMLNASVENKREAIRLAGKLLVEKGHVTAEYIEKMLEREEMLTTYLGNGVAIPHGTNDSKQWIKSTGISIVQVPSGVDFGDGNIAYVIIGIAGKGDEHLEILSKLAEVCMEEENVKSMVQAAKPEQMIEILEKGE
ncbi:PTS sugar transporter subunit IIA [Brevibacillus massiliensis]|uniref:PTS sugar transporter subunit IIA n=1 Tax=Brevibacillus massiliensis TaxID=1118054 RepID=UPI0003038C6A|nr:PTS sugar transporter subunit IIA [Brevibacillus massiliensis]